MISGIQSLLIAVSQMPDVRRMDAERCSSYLADLGPQLVNLAAITVLDTEGHFRCGSVVGPSADVSAVGRSYFQEALKAPEWVVGDYEVGKVSGRAILPIAMALRDAGGATVGVLVASVDLGWLGKQMKARGVPPGGSLTVADRRGVILAREPLAGQFVGTRIPEAFMWIVNAPAPGFETIVSQDGTRRVLGFMPVSERSKGLYVSVGLSAEASYETVDRAARVGALLALGAGLATLAATWLVGSRAFLRPIHHLTNVLDRWRKGERSLRTGLSEDAGEIGALGGTLDRMMDEILASEEQRSLLANELSHRVKNTLATVQAIATATLNKSRPANEILPDFLARITALARTHEVLTRDRWEGSSLRDLAARVIQPLCGDIDARFRIEGPPVDLPSREALGMTMVLHELCTNALKYGALSEATGHVDLTWSLVETGEEPAIRLVWHETGGPPVASPNPRAGFGSRLIARAFGSAGTAVMTFDPAGLVCVAEVSLAGTGGPEV